jgi:hypothetical protein
LILELILLREGLIKISRILSRLNLAIFIASIVLIAFLKFFSNSVDFISLSEVSRVFYLSIEVAIAISIYFALTRLIYGKNLRKIFN